MTLPSGTRLGGYRLESLLGRGGMGEVYRAADERLGRTVALKLVNEQLSGRPGIRERFLAESRLAASLDHPHIVPIYEAGEDNGRLYLAMRYVAGSDLEALVRGEGALTPARAVALLTGIADALDAAHDRGLIHRDVKPSNILVARTERGGEHAYLGDFGLVKQLGSGTGLTATGQLLGSVDYVAPEQVEGRPIDGRVDVYSLACVLYTCLTGSVPYLRETDMATLWAHVQAPPPRPSEANPVLAPFDSVIARGMAKDSAERTTSAGELLREARAAVAIGERPPPGEAASRAAASRGAWIVGAVAGLALLAVAAGSLGSGLLRTAAPSPTPGLSVVVVTSPSPVTSATTGSSVVTSPSPVTSATAGSSPGPTASSSTVPIPPGPLEQGSYVSRILEPNVSFSVGGGWTLVEELPQWILLIDASAPNRNFYISGLRAAIDPTEEPRGYKAEDIELTPNGLISWLEQHPRLDVRPRFDVNFGGVRGVGVDFEAMVSQAQSQGCSTPCVALFLVTDEPSIEDRFGVNSRWLYRIAAVPGPSYQDGPSQLVLFITETSNAAEFAAFAPKALEVAATVRFPEPLASGAP